MHIIDIALKDLTQLLRTRETFLFMLFMPAVMTLMFGFAFGGFGPASDDRLPVGWLDQDGSNISHDLRDMLDGSEVIRLVDASAWSEAMLAQRVGDGDLAAGMIAPVDFGVHLKEGKPVKLGFIGDTGTTTGMTVESEVLAALIHLESATRTAGVLEDQAGAPFDYVYAQTLEAWNDPPVKVIQTVSPAVPVTETNEGMANTSPGMMLQFSIAGLLVSAQIIVNERKTRCLQRLLTTSARRVHILLGHYLAIFTLSILQLTLLIAYGQLLLGVNYLYAPLATALIAISVAVWIGGMGLLIGVLARNEDQAVVFALVPMFALTMLGGGWVPLEVVGPTFSRIGHLSPVAWGMDGFKNVIIRGLGVEAALLPAGMLIAYGAVFLVLAIWRFWRLEEM